MTSDLVGRWEVSLADKVHVIEFEHGTTSGKRVIRVDNQEILRKEWMFKLVGRECFAVGKNKTKCMILIDAISGFAYEYTLEVNGKSLQKFSENQSKVMQAWALTLDGVPTRIALEKDTLDVWVNGKRMETMGEFTDEGTETHFTINGTHSAYIAATSSGKRRTGIVHTLYVDDVEIPLANE